MINREKFLTIKIFDND